MTTPIYGTISHSINTGIQRVHRESTQDNREGANMKKNATQVQQNKPRNFVAKHMQVNRAAVQKDRKKDEKRGYCKHKGGKSAPFDICA